MVPRRHLLLQPLHLLLDGVEVGVGAAQHILHGVACGEFGDLGDQAQTLVGIDVDLAVVIVHLAGEDLEERGLAAAVPAQDRHSLPLLDVKGQTIQKIFTDGEKFYQVFDLYIDHLVFSKMLFAILPSTSVIVMKETTHP